MRRGRFVLAALASASLGAAACFGSGGVQTVDRILVLSEPGDVFTVRPDGEGRLDLTSDATATRWRRQPVWSPTAERVAWVEIDGRSGVATSALATARVDGSEPTFASTDAPAFFAYWNPTGSMVAYLAPEAAAIQLGVVDVTAGGDVATPLAHGQPFYFSWAPDGSRVFSHVGRELLSYVSIDGSQSPVVESGGVFLAPQWDLERDRLLYVVQTPNAQSLVVDEQDGSGRRELLSFEGAMRFSLSSNGRLLAYRVTGGSGEDDDGSSSVAGAGEVVQAITGALVIHDLVDDRPQPLTTEPVISFFWSPDGDSLLYMVPEQIGGQLWLRWYVWDGDSILQLESSLPTLVYWRDYLPFFEQYAQALSPWSPDSSRFVYAGTDRRGESGIWVQAADGAVPPIFVAEGVFASWSPR